MKRIGINIGFITNSSSCVHHVPRAILDDPEISAFLEAFEVNKGFVGTDLWHRGLCSSLLVTDEQKAEARRQLHDGEYKGPAIPDDPNLVTVIYGDEHESIAHTLMALIERKIGDVPHDDYN